MARGVRRGVGEGGRQAARRRGRGGGRRHRRCAGVAAQRSSARPPTGTPAGSSAGCARMGGVPITLHHRARQRGQGARRDGRRARALARGEEPLLVVPTRADAEHYRRELAGRGRGAGRARGALRRSDRRGGRAAPDGRAGRPLARERCSRRSPVRQLPRPSARRRAGAGPASQAASGRGAQRRRRVVRALDGVVAELQVRRVTPARLGGRWPSWTPADGADARQAGALGRPVRRLPAHAPAARAHGRRAAAPCARSTRCDASPRCGGRRRCCCTASTTSTPLQLDAIETLGRVVDAPVTVSLTYEPGRTAFAGRAAHVPDALRRSPPSTAAGRARRLLRARRARGAAATSSARCSSRRRRGCRSGGSGAPARGRGRARRARAGRGRDRRAAGRRHGAAARSPCVARAAGTDAELLEEVFAQAGVPYALQRRTPFADTAIGGRCGRAALRRADGEAPARSATCSRWLRAPGLLDRPELADRLELQAAPRRRHQRGAGAGAVGASATGRWTRSTSLARRPARGAGGADRPRRARAPVAVLRAPQARRRACWTAERARRGARAVGGRRALGELRELAPVAPELVAEPTRRAGRPAGAARGRQRRASRSGRRGRRARPAVAARAARARAVRVRPAGRRLSRRARARSRSWPRRSAAGWPRRSGLRARASARTRSPPSATCCTRPSRARRSCSCSAGIWPTTTGSRRARSLFVDDVCDLFERGAARAAVARGRQRRPRRQAPRRPPGASRGRAATGTPARRARCWASCARTSVVGVLAGGVDRAARCAGSSSGCCARARSTPTPSRSPAAAWPTPR